MNLTVLDLCSGGGGEALGLERAGFVSIAAVEIEPFACATLRANRPAWNVLQGDIRELDGAAFRGVDLVAAGAPCPPFSIAGRQLGSEDERDLFPDVLRIIEASKPAVVMLENVRGLATAKFASYRRDLLAQLNQLGYDATYQVLSASDFGTPQLRPRFVLIAIRPSYVGDFWWPVRTAEPPTVGDALGDLIGSRGWPGTPAWLGKAHAIAPTLVGGSRKHGGPDLGPTRAKKEWATLGVDGLGIADQPPGPDFPEDGLPRLTLRMTARIQGFPDDWQFAGGKTAAYRQIGNAFPPNVAEAVGRSIRAALLGQAITGANEGQQAEAIRA
jgi:DNA (cytosine-5)-methyltransferase 1